MEILKNLINLRKKAILGNEIFIGKEDDAAYKEGCISVLDEALEEVSKLEFLFQVEDLATKKNTWINHSEEMKCSYDFEQVGMYDGNKWLLDMYNFIVKTNEEF